MHEEPLSLPPFLFTDGDGLQHNTCLGCRVNSKLRRGLNSTVNDASLDALQAGDTCEQEFAAAVKTVLNFSRWRSEHSTPALPPQYREMRKFRQCLGRNLFKQSRNFVDVLILSIPSFGRSDRTIPLVSLNARLARTARNGGRKAEGASACGKSS